MYVSPSHIFFIQIILDSYSTTIQQCIQPTRWHDIIMNSQAEVNSLAVLPWRHDWLFCRLFWQWLHMQNKYVWFFLFTRMQLVEAASETVKHQWKNKQRDAHFKHRWKNKHSDAHLATWGVCLYFTIPTSIITKNLSCCFSITRTSKTTGYSKPG